MKPIIGVTTYYIPSDEYATCKPRGRMDQDMITSTADYAQSLERAGAIPLLIPVYDQADNIRAVLERLDGIILSGGEDLDPVLYGQDPHDKLGTVVRKRDDHEYKVIEIALELKLPIFAICRGHQVLNAYLGGTLIQDIQSQLLHASDHVERHLPRWEGVHEVIVQPGSLLSQLTEDERLTVNSLHHQAVDRLADGLQIDAVSPDGIVEAYHGHMGGGVVGVQWHPEMMACCEKTQTALFDYFVQVMTRK